MSSPVVNASSVKLVYNSTSQVLVVNADKIKSYEDFKNPENAIALNSAQFNLSRVLGPTLGGFVMAWLGIPANFLLNALSFLAVIFALNRIEYPPQPQQDDSAGLWQRLGEGFRYVFERRQMSSLVWLVALASIFGVPFLMFVPLFARDILQVGERGLGLLMACSGAGARAC